MGAGERAKLYLLRKKGRAAILLAILLVITTLVFVCTSVGNAANRAIVALRETMGGYFKIETNDDKGYNTPVDDDFVQKILDNGGVKAYNGIDITYMFAENLELEPGRFSLEGDEKARLVRVLGNTDSSLNEYFVLHSFSLKEGRHITAQDTGKAIISESLAKRNHLSPGDSFTVVFDHGDSADEKGTASYALEIVGIFQIDVPQSGGVNAAECDIADNFIFTDTEFVRTVIGEALNKEVRAYSNGAAFFAEDPKELQAVIESVKAIPGYDWNGYSIMQNNKMYQESSVPLERLSGFLTLMVSIIVIISAALLSLILVLWMRERIHEIGIYISMGMSKGKIAGQLVLENLSVACIAFFLAVIIAACTMSVVEKTVEKSLEATMEDENFNSATAVSTEARQNNPVSLEVHIGALEVVEVFGIGFLIVLLSTGISSGIVLRMNPKEIFSTMS